MRTIHTAPVVLPIAAPQLRDGAILVDGDRIAEVGSAAELTSAHPDVRVRDWTGVLLPGLVNAHAHLQYSDFADLATSGLPFPEWIRTLTARRPTFTDAMWVESTRRGIHQMLKTGTTAVADIVTDECVLLPTARSGIGGISYVEAVGHDDARWATDDGRAKLINALDAAPPGRAIGVSPHSAYTLGTAVFADCVAIARSRGLRMHPHLAETTNEVEWVLSGSGAFKDVAERLGWAHEILRDGGTGLTPVAYYDKLDALGSDIHVAHGCHCTSADRQLLRDRSTTVALCTRSNAILQAGEAPVADYLAEGSPIAIGTDSLASSPSLDLLEEAVALRALALKQGYAGDDLSERIVRAATLGGAEAMGLEDAGVLKPGMRADFAVFAVSDSTDPYAALLDSAASGSHCLATALGGRLVHRG